MIPTTELLASVLRGEPMAWPPGTTHADEDALVEAADAHGVTALVGYTLAALSAAAAGAPPAAPRWPRRVVEILGERASQEAALHLVRMRELKRILARLASRAVHPVLTKGVVLAHRIYAQPHLRPGFDVDLLVAESEIAATKAIFEEDGYRPSRQVGGNLVMPQFDYEKQCELGVWHMFDVHFRAVNPHVFAETLPLSELSADATPIGALGPFARGTSAHHALLLACLHRVAHHPREDRLIWLYDIHLLAEHLRASGLARLAQVAGQKQICGVVGAGLAAARAVFNTTMPDGLVEDLEARSVSANEASRSFLNGQTKLGELWSDLRIVPRWRDRLRLLGQHVFPSSAYMLRRYEGRPPALLPALYTHRLVTGAWRWLKGAPAGPEPEPSHAASAPFRSPRA